MGYVEKIKSIMQWGNSLERQGDFPLDRTDLHISYDDAVLYAKGDASDSRKLGKLAYIGQIITVWGLNENGIEGVWVYSLIPHTPTDENDKTLADLKPVGGEVDLTPIYENLQKIESDIANINEKIGSGTIITTDNITEYIVTPTDDEKIVISKTENGGISIKLVKIDNMNF